MRIKVIQDFDQYRAGDVIETTKKTGELLIKKGLGIKSKDMTSKDFRIK